MACIHKDCICTSCEIFKTGDCWRAKRCSDPKNYRSCVTRVTECSRNTPAKADKKEAKHERRKS